MLIRVTAAVAELVEEHLGRGHGAEQIDLHHLTELVALFGGERGQQHDPGVVDQDIGTSKFGLYPISCGDE
jgi:hypothetical protein